MGNQHEAVKKTTRLKEIVAVMRKYHFLSNFYRQGNPEAICAALQEWVQPLSSWGKFCRHDQT